MKKHLLYRLFGGGKESLEDALPENHEPTLKNYFKMLGRKFWKLVSLNLMMLPIVAPILVIFYIITSIPKTPVANSELFAQLYGASLIEKSPSWTVLADLFAPQQQISVYQPIGAYIGIGICALFLLVTFGWQNVGAAYVLRGLVRGDPVFIWTDYFYAVKRNLKQGFFLGLLDAVAIFLLGFDFLYFSGMTGSYGKDLLFFGICALIILYFFMRFYLYLLLVTFNLSIRKILKNALIFTVLGVKRNLMGFLGIAAVTALNIALIVVFAQISIAIPLVLPFLYYLAVTSFTATYAAYPVIDRYMIEPYRSTTEESTEAE